MFFEKERCALWLLQKYHQYAYVARLVYTYPKYCFFVTLKGYGATKNYHH